MDTLNSLISKVNTATKNAPIFFVTNDAERAIGLENVLDNYHIICIDDNDIVGYMLNSEVKIFCLEKKLTKLNAIFRNSNRLLQTEEAKNHIKNNSSGKGYLMFFKIAPNLEKTASKMGFDLLNTSSKLNRMFELKIPQYKFLKELNVRIPKTEILVLEDANFSKLVKTLGSNFITQFNRGHTGGGTIEIDSQNTLEELKKVFPQREVKAVQHIYGNSYTLNACVTKQGICWGALSYQITGFEECTSKKLATVGNDWTYPTNLSKDIKQKIGQFTKIIGQGMAEQGFAGMFGLDIVVNKKEEPYVIEINARQPASTSMFTKLQLAKGQIPLQLLAICEFLDIDYNIDIEKYNSEASDVFDAAQIFIRNKFENPAKIVGGVKVGAYRLVGDNSAYKWNKGRPTLRSNVIIIDENKDKPLVLEQKAYSIDNVKAGILIYCAKEGKIVNPNAEVSRLQANQSLLDKNGKPKTWIQEVIKGLNKYIILKEISN
jgi:predicted ATP-grasp superfamily ATP-dependent carboligase